MKPTPESNSVPSAEVQRLQLLLSGQFDGELSAEESSVLAASPQTAAEKAFENSIFDLRVSLKAIPVRPVAPSFADSVLAGIHTKPAEFHRISIVAPEPRRGWVRRSIVAVSIAACALILMMVAKPFSALPTAVTYQSPVAARQMTTAARDENTPEIVPLADTQLAGAERQAAKLPEAESPEQQAEMQIYLKNHDWTIVLVRVKSKDRESVMRDIEGMVAKQGMDLRSLGDGHSDVARFGVLLTSAGVDEKIFVESVLPEVDFRSANWDADSVAESSREDLIRRVQESLRTPTHSELYFGEVYVTLPKPFDSETQAFLAKADSPGLEKLESGSRGSAAAAIAAANLAERKAARQEEIPAPPAEAGKSSGSSETAVPRKPVLVVFEFTDAATHGGFDGRI